MKNTFDKIDFNLLKILMVLLDERSVTRAADRLCVTQSAASKTLRRLRELFEDPLLIRQGSGLIPTPLAERLVEPLREIVTRVEGCFDLCAFDPAAATGTIRIAAPEQLALGVVPELTVRLLRKAPGLALDSRHLTEDFRERLASGKTDFVISSVPIETPGFSDRLLYSARPMLWHRIGHPISDLATIGMADICAYPLVSMKSQFSEQEIDSVRRQLLAASLRPEVVLVTTHVGVAIAALLRSDALSIAPDFLSWLPTVSSALAARPISHIDLYRQFRADIHLTQHRRTTNSLLHQWIASEIADILAAKGEGSLSRAA